MIGIRGTVLKWFSSYILNRSSSVKICNFSTQSRIPHYGVAQGSVLGPLLFSIYILPIHDIIGQFPDVHYHIYADDFNYIPSYPTHPMYYQITHNYVNVHQLSDHGFYLTIFYLTLQNLHS